MSTPAPKGLPRGEWALALAEAAAARRTARNNLKFSLATPAQKRVTLARDVLQWLASNKLVAAGSDSGTSTYLEVQTTDHVEPIQLGDLLNVGKVNGYACQACALGSLFAVAVERDLCPLFSAEGKQLGMDGRGARSIHTAMQSAGLFDVRQMVLIEGAYEGKAYDTSTPFADTDDTDEMARAVAFGKAFEDRGDRLHAIMDNIIKNRGTFVA